MVLSFLRREPQAPPPNPALILAEAQQYLQKEDFEGALGKLDELCALPVQSPMPLLSRATCRLQLKQYEGVLEDCEKVLKFLNSDISGQEVEGCTTVHSLALLRMAKAYKDLDRMDEARNALMRRNAIEHKLGRDKAGSDAEDDGTDEKTANEWKEKGNEQYRQERWEQALDCYRNGLGYDIYNPKIHSNTCMSLIKLKRWTQALKHAEQCIALEPKWVKGYYMKGLILSSESKIEQSLSALRQALEIEPDNAKVRELFEEVEARVSYVESRLRHRRKTDQAEKDSARAQPADDSGNEDEPVEDVDSDEDYCADGSCSTPKTIKLRVTRKDAMATLVEVFAALAGVVLVWWLARKD
ncbi:hypothetical protein GGF46_001232 [Coemansia sp. RSA 552]|nr:hypothetical protein GGF46_001232 [Coemansia sp. RSA 552]